MFWLNQIFNRDTENGVEVSSTTEHPFIALMWIGNGARLIPTFDLKVMFLRCVRFSKTNSGNAKNFTDSSAVVPPEKYIGGAK